MSTPLKTPTINSPAEWFDDLTYRPRRTLTAGALRSGKDATTAVVLEQMHERDPNMEFWMFSPPLDDLPPWINTTLDLNHKRIWDDSVSSALWINEALIALNPQDWATENSKKFARKLPISSHKDLRIFASSQSGEALAILNKTVNYRVFKRMNMELMEALFRSRVYLRQFFANTERMGGRGIFQKMSLEDTIVDTGSGVPLYIKIGKERLPEWYTEKVSKNWGDVHDDTIMEITGIAKSDIDLDDIDTRDYNQLDYVSFLALHIHSELTDEEPTDVSIDNFMASFSIASAVYDNGRNQQRMRMISKSQTRDTLPRIKILHDMTKCPYCDPDNMKTIRKRMRKMREEQWLTPDNHKFPLFE